MNGKNWPENNLLERKGPGTDNGKIRYWWVANPYTGVNTTSMNTLATTYQGNPDLLAAKSFAHMDKNPTQDPTGVPAGADFDTTRPCKPGVDYLRKISDKHQQEVAICVDRSKQTGLSAGNPTGGSYFMHGNPSKKGAAWKNELFGDGHCEPRRSGELRKRWAPANPQEW